MGKNSIKLISVNIELDRRLDLVHAFFEKEKPDVVCLQEVYEPDLKDFAGRLGMQSAFASMGRRSRELTGPSKEYERLGVALLSRLPLENITRLYYFGDESSVDKVIDLDDAQQYYRVVLCGMAREEAGEFVVGTTHFTWVPDGRADAAQRRDGKALLRALERFPAIVLCGDFNAPREGEIFSSIAQRYKDNIPAHYTTSIDVNLHRSGERLRGKPLMVDGLFTTPRYECSNVRLQDGVSDHMAIVATVRSL